MIDTKLNFGEYKCLFRTDIEPLSSYVINEFSKYTDTNISKYDFESVVSTKKGIGMRFARPHPGVRIELKENQYIINYDVNLLSKLRYGKHIFNHSSVISWLTYLAIYFPLFREFEKLGFTPIHAGLVSFENEGILITGRGGVGKSTFITHLIEEGSYFGGDNLVLFNASQNRAIPLLAPIKIDGDNIKNISLLNSLIDDKKEERGIVRIFPTKTINKPIDIQKIVLIGDKKEDLKKTLSTDRVLSQYRIWRKEFTQSKLANFEPHPNNLVIKEITSLKTLNLDEARVIASSILEKQ